MKRLVIVIVAAVATLGVAAGPAAGQEDTTTTTVESEATTTIVTPDVSLPDPPAEDPPAEDPPAEDPPVTIPQIDLPGEHVTSGELFLGASFETAETSSCTTSGSVAGGEVNIMKDEAGNIGVVYGKADLGAAEAGLVMVALGPLPLAIGAFRTTGACNQDVVAIGAYEGSPTTASLESVGYGLYPQDFATSVQISLQVGATEPTASLNLQGAYDFLAAERPAG